MVKTIRQEKGRGSKLINKVKVYTYKHVNGSKDLLCIRETDDYGYTDYDYQVNAQGYVTRKQNHRGNTYGDIIAFEYAQGKLVKIADYNKTNKLTQQRFLFYTQNGKSARDSLVVYRGTKSYTSIYIYKYKGEQLIEKIGQDDTGNVLEKTVYGYDAKNRIVSEARYRKDGKLYATWTNVYDENGFLVKRYVTGLSYPVTKKQLVYEKNLELDTHGNWVNQIHKNSEVTKITRKIIYK
ncbi:hypothetical protein BKI52_12165 [marine bacterium AO1-C]|nr:hypothetical protein BKI52_12165 [marine bacterium AO1-C]